MDFRSVSAASQECRNMFLFQFCWKMWGTYQVLGVEGDFVPPGRHKLVVAVQDAAVHVLVASRVKERLKAAEPGGQEAEL